ncbi:Homeobox-leucine zipper protein HOX32 [Platanthera zijinensis]|uniref:Homeobox-leucine zipper protein HOX32 n=1 Tax=Platanthera zijinensis TaxID=2320716 RepID=A0AAP0G9Y4_9ASPA
MSVGRKHRVVADALALLQVSLLFLSRYREKQRKEASRLQTVNRKLTAMNELLMEENDRLQKQVSHLVYENGYVRQQVHNVAEILKDCLNWYRNCRVHDVLTVILTGNGRKIELLYMQVPPSTLASPRDFWILRGFNDTINGFPDDGWSLMGIQFLREHHSEWADSGVDAYSAASLSVSPFAVPGPGSCEAGGAWIKPG